MHEKSIGLYFMHRITIHYRIHRVYRTQIRSNTFLYIHTVQYSTCHRLKSRGRWLHKMDDEGIDAESVHRCFIHVCLSKWQCMALPTRSRASVRALFFWFPTFLDYSTNIIKSCAHRGTWARWERQTMFKIVTWTKETWIIHQCTWRGW